MSYSAILHWIEANEKMEGFEKSLLKLFSFACADWIKRECGVILTAEEGLSWFLGKETAFPIAEWIENPRKFSREIAVFCEKSKNSTIPESLKRPYPQVLDLRGVKCPMNSVRSRVFLCGFPLGKELEIYLDEGSPIENVPGALIADGHSIVSREKKLDYWALKVVKRSCKE